MIMAIILLIILFSILSIVSKRSIHIDLPRNISVLIIISIVILLGQVIIGTEESLLILRWSFIATPKENGLKKFQVFL